MIHIIFHDIMILAKELGALALLYLLIRVLMRLSKTTAGRHQLPPGPKGYPVVGVLPLLFAKTNIHVALADWAKTYGATMYLKVGTEGMVVASTPDSAKAFLKTHGSNFTNRPSFTSTNIISYNLQDMAMRRDDATWKMLRKLSNVHVLGSSALANWAHVRALEAGHMLADMCRAGERREAVVMPQVLACIVANVTGQVTLSKRIFTTEGSEANEFREVVEEIIRAGTLFNITDFIPSIGWLDLQGVEKVFKSLQRKFDKLISKMLEEHEASAHTRKDQPDLVDVLTANRDDPNLDERLSTTNIKATIVNFLLAGVDSISVTIEWALAEMIKNPTILNRALDEMDRVIGRNRRLVESDIPNLPYLQAICTETFRLHPATPINLPRVASEACTVDGYYIPKNTRLSINSWAIGRDPNTWEDPLEFKPERFMQGGEYAKIDPLGDDFRIVTFGSGRRYCAGSRMAVVLVEYVLGTLVHSFDWELASGVGEINMDEGIGLAVHKAVPIEAFVTPRLGSHCYAP